MILVFESVWMWPSRSLTKPRTVYIVGRPVRSMPNFASTAARKAGPSSSSIRALKRPLMDSSAGGCEPGPGMRGKSATTGLNSAGRMKFSTMVKSNGSRVSGVASKAARSRMLTWDSGSRGAG